jgi:hypothetical protein
METAAERSGSVYARLPNSFAAHVGQENATAGGSSLSCGSSVRYARQPFALTLEMRGHSPHASTCTYPSVKRRPFIPD